MSDDEPKGYKNYKLTTAEAAGRRLSDMSGWRKEIQAAKVRFDDTAKGIYLNVLAKTGRKGQSAKAAGVTIMCVQSHRNADPDFQVAEQEALTVWRDYVHTHSVRTWDGSIKEPIMGGKFKDEVVGHKEIIHANILAMELRRVDPEYKDRAEIDLAHRGGVLVVPATIDMDQFMAEETKRNEDKKEPGTE